MAANLHSAFVPLLSNRNAHHSEIIGFLLPTLDFFHSIPRLPSENGVLLAGSAEKFKWDGFSIVKSTNHMNFSPMTIRKTALFCEPEPLVRPFGFKGGAMTEIWQTAAGLVGESAQSVGLCTQNVLWCDAKLFAQVPEFESNTMMRDTTAFALSLLNGKTFASPAEAFDSIFPAVYEYARKRCGRDDLRPTFALNALVGVDNALWTLWFRENRLRTFDDLIPDECRAALSQRHKQVAAIPLLSYNVPIPEVVRQVESGSFFMKIKIGRPGTQEEMLEGDKNRLTEIHRAIGHLSTDAMADGKIPYYFDANGRYEKKETLLRLLDHAEKIGMLPQIALVEEPFDEFAPFEVGDLPVRLAADESAHSVDDVRTRIDMGYGAIALKPAAKTLTVSMRMAAEAHKRKIPCFCADLTVNPILVDWNKNVAARLDPFPGISAGLLESNGHQNYARWQTLLARLPDEHASWVTPTDGFYRTDSDFFDQSGRIFDEYGYYPEQVFSR